MTSFTLFPSDLFVHSLLPKVFHIISSHTNVSRGYFGKGMGWQAKSVNPYEQTVQPLVYSYHEPLSCVTETSLIFMGILKNWYCGERSMALYVATEPQWVKMYIIFIE